MLSFLFHFMEKRSDRMEILFTIVDARGKIIIKTKSILFLFQNTLQEHNFSHSDPEIHFQYITMQSLR
ncbi:hypothetical protein FA950_27600 [Bacillus thuringiensis]|nr:hypothetical protein DZB90_26795 [Bacillus thuringiensis]TKA00425.1 hypothetical protein FA950_27600 [Bacillus thuringiensis]